MPSNALIPFPSLLTRRESRQVRTTALAQDYVNTPHGLVHKTCFSMGSPGKDDPVMKCGAPRLDPRTGMPISRDGFSTRSTWVEFIDAPCNAIPVGAMSVTCKVPNAPVTPGALLYLFPALQPSVAADAAILQPVIQWGNNNAFGGDYWVASAWHCDSLGRSRSSQAILINPGDTIVTSMTSERGDGGRVWTIRIDDVQCGTHTELCTLPLTTVFDWIVAGAVETASDDCSTYPADGKIAFHDIAVFDTDGKPLLPEWHYMLNPLRRMCGFSGRIESTPPASVTMTFNAEQAVAQGGNIVYLSP